MVRLQSRRAGNQKGLLLHNSSEAPVFDVEVLSTYAAKRDQTPQDQPPLRITILPPGDFVANEHPTYHWSFPESLAYIEGAVRPIMKNSGWIVTTIQFTDSHGLRWVRDAKGQLKALARQ